MYPEYVVFAFAHEQCITRCMDVEGGASLWYMVCNVVVTACGYIILTLAIDSIFCSDQCQTEDMEVAAEDSPNAKRGTDCTITSLIKNVTEDTSSICNKLAKLKLYGMKISACVFKANSLRYVTDQIQKKIDRYQCYQPVSYTHLTLPTIYSV